MLIVIMSSTDVVDVVVLFVPVSEGIQVRQQRRLFWNWEGNLDLEAYNGAGVTVTTFRLEQSARRLLKGGLFPAVPPTPRWQLFPDPHAAARTSIICALAVNAAGKRSMSENFMVLDRVLRVWGGRV